MAKINKNDLKIGVTFTRCRECDRVEVVRCKDCVHNVANWNHSDPLDITDYTDITCDYHMTDGMYPNDFCSYGKIMAKNPNKRNKGVGMNEKSELNEEKLFVDLQPVDESVHEGDYKQGAEALRNILLKMFSGDYDKE